jgi:hypothetical protein
MSRTKLDTATNKVQVLQLLFLFIRFDSASKVICDQGKGSDRRLEKTAK